MIQLDVEGRRHGVVPGDMLVGSDPDAAIPLFGSGVAPQHAMVQGWPDGSAAIRALGNAEVQVNGIRLGAEPTPLLHGDKIRIGSHDILVQDDARVGRTRLMPALSVDSPPVAGGHGGVVCLTDGREYTLDEGALVFGREAGADVVVPSTEVSRRHAELHPTADGVMLLDTSVNGTFVNGARVSGQRLLRHGDVVRVGTEEFRYHAAVPEAAAAAVASTTVAIQLQAPGPVAPARLSDTMFGMPAVRPAAVAEPPVEPDRPSLASVLFRSGPQKGERVELRVPVVNVGRADYNDLVIADPSVSTMHAKIQRRQGVWLLTDLGSTNGTFVDGELAAGDMALSPGGTLRFGEITVLFEPLDNDAPVEPVGTRVTERVVEPTPFEPPALNPVPAAERRRPAPRAPRPAPEPERRSRWWLLLLLAALAAAAAFLFLEQ
ncbi:MAG TPA: FHA domain-containing protein [Gemmatimonadales bacterium]|nr:FHA domain-containing protein [Gemmatimonadales bacterium]